MKRKLTKDLFAWLKEPDRLPLVLRGARQVGKTWLIKEFANLAELELYELNFERDPAAKDYFIDNDPQKILLRLQAHFNKEIIPSKSLLFLDGCLMADINPFFLILLRTGIFRYNLENMESSFCFLYIMAVYA